MFTLQFKYSLSKLEVNWLSTCNKRKGEVSGEVRGISQARNRLMNKKLNKKEVIVR